jgi:hypothetical protein
MFRWIPSLILMIFVALPAQSRAVEIKGRPTVGVSFSVTELSFSEIQAVSKTVHDAFQTETSFDQGCEARAHLISQYLDRANIHNGLLYTEENLLPVMNPRTKEKLTWAYHVAVTLLGTDQEWYVIDPFFEENLFLKKDWLKLTVKNRKTQVDWVAPYFWTPPYQMSEQMISETNHFDSYEFKKAQKLYPNAARALGLSSGTGSASP